jgi:hypothetical protein
VEELSQFSPKEGYYGDGTGGTIFSAAFCSGVYRKKHKYPQKMGAGGSSRYANSYFSGLKELESNKIVSTLELRRLFFNLRDQRPDICIRLRLLGKTWTDEFVKIKVVTEQGALFEDEKHDQLIHVSDMLNIIQFELDKPFGDLLPYFHYEVIPDFY